MKISVLRFIMKRLAVLTSLLLLAINSDAQNPAEKYTHAWIIDTAHSKVNGLSCDSVVADGDAVAEPYNWNDEIQLLSETDSTLTFRVVYKPCEADIVFITASYRLDDQGILRIATGGFGRIVQAPRHYAAVIFFSKTELFESTSIRGIAMEGDSSFVAFNNGISPQKGKPDK